MRWLWILALLPLLGGCGFDYLNHQDGVTFGAGNAVDSNLAMETVNPEKRSMYNTAGLGNYGVVMHGNAASGYKGNCEYADQKASDGSNCGLRSAQDQAGGFVPPPEPAH